MAVKFTTYLTFMSRIDFFLFIPPFLETSFSTVLWLSYYFESPVSHQKKNNQNISSFIIYLLSDK
jgi:hypothetical protein